MVASTATDLIILKTRYCRLAEVFYDADPGDIDADIVEYFQRSRPLEGSRCRNFHTVHLDLAHDSETLFSQFSKTCRYNIRRAERANVQYVHWPPERQPVTEFVSLFNRFAAGKGRPPLGTARLEALAEARLLDITNANSEGEPLVWHANLCTGGRARMLHSASLFRESDDSRYRKFLGRANRFLHWQDVLRYKDAGLRIFDLGGWYSGNEDREKLDINKFKAEFGGRIVREFHCTVPQTMRGRIVLLGRQLREVKARRAQDPG
jgi:Acetyltransferase (GNAT) domain